MPLLQNLDLQNLDLQNLDLQGATHAIVATPEQAMALINMNNQLDMPYEIKGAYLI